MFSACGEDTGPCGGLLAERDCSLPLGFGIKCTLTLWGKLQDKILILIVLVWWASLVVQAIKNPPAMQE